MWNTYLPNDIFEILDETAQKKITLNVELESRRHSPTVPLESIQFNKGTTFTRGLCLSEAALKCLKPGHRDRMKPRIEHYEAWGYVLAHELHQSNLSTKVWYQHSPNLFNKRQHGRLHLRSYLWARETCPFPSGFRSKYESRSLNI